MYNLFKKGIIIGTAVMHILNPQMMGFQKNHVSICPNSGTDIWQFWVGLMD